VIGYLDLNIEEKSRRFVPTIHHVAAKKTIVELTARPSELHAEGSVMIDVTFEAIEVGVVVTAYISKVGTDVLWVDVGSHTRGRIKLFDISEDIDVLADLTKYFQVGEALECRVISKNSDQRILDLCVGTVVRPSVTDYESLSVGMIVVGRVSKVQPDRGIVVQLSLRVWSSLSYRL